MNRDIGVGSWDFARQYRCNTSKMPSAETKMRRIAPTGVVESPERKVNIASSAVAPK